MYWDEIAQMSIHPPRQIPKMKQAEAISHCGIAALSGTETNATIF